MRTNQARKTGPALLDPLAQSPPAGTSQQIRRSPSEPLRIRRDSLGAPSNSDADDNDYLRARRNRRIRQGLIPQTRNGRLFAGACILLALGALAAVAFATARYIHRDPHFTVASSSSIELHGNAHLSRPQLLSIFGEDIDQNIFNIPLAERRDQLQQMPWVEHAAVMRLLPNRLRIDIVERTPVAFVRQGGSIGMTDAQGVLLDIPPDAPGNPNYSFPVVTGLKASDSAESRQQRMHLYAALLKDLDADGKKISAELSEVDLSDPEDVKVLLPSGNTETLVHFGTNDFLPRYKRFQEHIDEWRTQYPRLTSVDMRYERQVVLQMPPKDSTVAQQPPAELHSEAKTGPAGRPAQAAVKQLPKSKATLTTAQPPANLASAKPAPQFTQRDIAPAPVKPLPLSPGQPVQRTLSTLPPMGAATPLTVAGKVVPAKPAESKPVTPHPAVTKHAAPVKPARQAEMAKRVEAIKAWMAKRQKMRDAQAAH